MSTGEPDLAHPSTVTAGARSATRPAPRQNFTRMRATPHRSCSAVRTMRTRLGVSHNLTQPINAWHKPKGMHWRTFARLQEQEERAQRAVWHQQHAWSTRMLGEIGEASAERGEARGAP